MGQFPDYRQALKDLLNVSSVDVAKRLERKRSGKLQYSPEEDEAETRRAEEFIRKYGPLRSLMFQVASPPPTPDSPATRVPSSAIVRSWSAAFDAAVNVSSTAREQSEELNKMFLAIFNDMVGPPGEERPTALNIDVLAGTFEPEARDLLDAMAIELIRARKVIARCALCSKFFFRQFNNDKYCSSACGSEARRKSQLEWIRNERANKPKKARKAR